MIGTPGESRNRTTRLGRNATNRHSDDKFSQMNKESRNSKTTRHSGMSIVELIVVMGIATTFLGLGIYTLHLLLRAERNTHQAARLGESMSRLSQHFRNDAHAATDVRVGPKNADEGTSVTLTMSAGRTVHYGLDAGRIVRIERLAETIKQQELFPMAAGSAVQFLVTDEPRIVSIVVQQRLCPTRNLAKPPGGGASTPASIRTTRIEAVEARDHRFGATRVANQTNRATDNN